MIVDIVGKESPVLEGLPVNDSAGECELLDIPEDYRTPAANTTNKFTPPEVLKENKKKKKNIVDPLIEKRKKLPSHFARNGSIE